MEMCGSCVFQHIRICEITQNPRTLVLPISPGNAQRIVLGYEKKLPGIVFFCFTLQTWTPVFFFQHRTPQYIPHQQFGTPPGGPGDSLNYDEKYHHAKNSKSSRPEISSRKKQQIITHKTAVHHDQKYHHAKNNKSSRKKHEFITKKIRSFWPHKQGGVYCIVRPALA